MHHRSHSGLAVTLASILAFAAVACSAAPEPTLADKSSDVKAKAPKPGGANPPAGASSNPTPSTGAGECGSKADGASCQECCYQKSPAEADKADAVFGDCICVAPGACKTDCADSVCGTDPNKQPSAACETCLKTNGPTCGAKADAACQASEGCKAVDACAQAECAKFDTAK